MGPALEQRPATFALLSTLFAQTFPQLEDVRFTHSWSGAIDTCSRFCAFFDRSSDGRVAAVAGYTGLGVGASRFGARVALDLVSGAETELTAPGVRPPQAHPVPPGAGPRPRDQPDPVVAWPGADAHQGRRNLWLRALDAVGLGFDS